MKDLLLSATSLQGNSVENKLGEALGSLEDIMIDVTNNRIAYAVLSFGGFLGLGEKLFAVPFEALSVNTEKQCFVLDVSRERLEQAPGFDKDDWPDMANLEWCASIDGFYASKNTAGSTTRAVGSRL